MKTIDVTCKRCGRQFPTAPKSFDVLCPPCLDSLAPLKGRSGRLDRDKLAAVVESARELALLSNAVKIWPSDVLDETARPLLNRIQEQLRTLKAAA